MQRTSDKFFFGTPFVMVLVIGMMISGCLSLAFGKEIQWDGVAYHYYNAYALIHHRWGLDIWPTNDVQLFLNPLMDWVSYFLIHHFTPFFAVFFLGAIHGINFWLMFCISYCVLTRNRETHRLPMAIMLAATGMMGTAVMSEIGSLMGDDLISLFGLGAVLLQLRFLMQYQTTGKTVFGWVFWSGCVLGFGVGLKLTLSYVVFGMFFAHFFISMPLKSKIKMCMASGMGLMIGFLMSYGYWMVILETHWQSPFFPFLNGFFKAPGFPGFNWEDTRFFPKTFFQKIFYPFYFAQNGTLIGDLQSNDNRLAVLYFLLLLNGVVYLWKRLRHFSFVIARSVFSARLRHCEERFLRRSNPETFSGLLHPVKNTGFAMTGERDGISQWLVLFFVAAYIAWQVMFSNIRYMISLQIMAPLVIYLMLYDLIHDPFVRRGVLAVTLVIIMLSTDMMAHVRMIILPGTSYFNVRLPSFVEKEKTGMVLTLVPDFSGVTEISDKTGVMAAVNATLNDADAANSYVAALQTYLIPFFPKDFRFVGVTTSHYEYVLPNKTRKMIQQYPGPIYILTSGRNMPSFLILARKMGFARRGACGMVSSDRLMARIQTESVLLCKVKTQSV